MSIVRPLQRALPTVSRLLLASAERGQLGLHLAELLALGLAPPDGPGDAGDAEQADQVEPDRPLLLPMDDRHDGQERDHVHDLDQRVEGRAGGVLEGSPTVSPVTAALCASEPLPP